METIKVVLDEGAYMPERAYEYDAGYDLRSREEKEILAGSSGIFDTGVHIAIPKGMVGFLKSKSGLNTKYSVVSEGVIDSGYTGSIVVKLYNNGEKSIVIGEGIKISQIVFLPIPDIKLVEVSELEKTERGNNGFGSTGK